MTAKKKTASPVKPAAKQSIDLEKLSGQFWLTVSELSVYINTPEDTLRQWRDRGNKGPTSYKLGGRVQYKRAEVDAWIKSQARETIESLAMTN